MSFLTSIITRASRYFYNEEEPINNPLCDSDELYEDAISDELYEDDERLEELQSFLNSCTKKEKPIVPVDLSEINGRMAILVELYERAIINPENTICGIKNCQSESFEIKDWMATKGIEAIGQENFWMMEQRISKIDVALNKLMRDITEQLAIKTTNKPPQVYIPTLADANDPQLTYLSGQ